MRCCTWEVQQALDSIDLLQRCTWNAVFGRGRGRKGLGALRNWQPLLAHPPITPLSVLSPFSLFASHVKIFPVISAALVLPSCCLLSGLQVFAGFCGFLRVFAPAHWTLHKFAQICINLHETTHAKTNQPLLFIDSTFSLTLSPSRSCLRRFSPPLL
jgi:hypothetical protein